MGSTRVGDNSRQVQATDRESVMHIHASHSGLVQSGPEKTASLLVYLPPAGIVPPLRRVRFGRAHCEAASQWRPGSQGLGGEREVAGERPRRVSNRRSSASNLARKRGPAPGFVA